MAKCAKRRYRSEIDAMIALSNAGNAHDGRLKSEVRCYRCPECKGWHLTSRPKRPTRNEMTQITKETCHEQA